MKRLLATWRWPSDRPAFTDGSWVNPSRWAGQSLDAIAALPLSVGRSTVRLGDVLDLAWDAAPAGASADANDAGDAVQVVLRGAPMLDRLGAGMASGMLVVEGDVGDDLGASMTGGLIRVTGSAGHCVGGPNLGSARGMNGGVIEVAGDAGRFAGLRMRRGVLVIRGQAPDAGYRMLAGTLIVGMLTGDAVGLEMRRGTIIETANHLTGSTDESEPAPRSLADLSPGPHFAPVGCFDGADVAALRLIWRYLAGLGVDPGPLPEVMACFTGDQFELHRGELWRMASQA